MTRYIFGMGTGRCGTMSLTRLLDMQEGARVSHERFVMPWNVHESIFDVYVHGLEAGESPVIGDVAFYLLPYARRLMMHFDCKLIIMCRDQRGTVASYMQKTRGTNHWQPHDGSDYANCRPWDDCYPKYPRCLTKPEAIAAYWDDYYDKAGEMARRWPDQVKLFATEDLNRGRCVAQLLHWLGFERPELRVGIRANQAMLD